MTNQKKFLQFNGRNIFFVAADGQYWIALKPICEALNVSWKNQHEKLLKDEILAQLSTEQGMVAADGKLRKMVSLPEFYVYGWIFQIQSDSPELLKYKWECYKVLYSHFKGMVTAREDILRKKTLAELEIERLEKELENSDEYLRIQELKSKNKKHTAELRKLDKTLVDAQLDLWKEQ